MTYYLRLDDACEKRDIEKWNKIENLMDQYGVKPLVGIIPHCEDPMMDKYNIDLDFWERVNSWTEKGWEIALHGYNHVFQNDQGGINPVNRKSEFAGQPLIVQQDKIRKGIEILRSHGVDPKVFFAPAHTFDENTIIALKEYSSVTCISDTIANAPYSKYGITFVPQQSGRVRKMPLKTVTFCLHPNTMSDGEFEELERFLKFHRDEFKAFPVEKSQRSLSFPDYILRYLYFLRRKIVG